MINAAKTRRNREVKGLSVDLIMDGTKVSVESEKIVKYLGIVVDQCLNVGQHIDNVITHRSR